MNLVLSYAPTHPEQKFIYSLRSVSLQNRHIRITKFLLWMGPDMLTAIALEGFGVFCLGIKLLKCDCQIPFYFWRFIACVKLNPSGP
jgi:hypothetical protein